MRILKCKMLDFLDIYWQILLSTNLPTGFKCGTYQVTRQYTSISQHCHIVHNMPRYRDVLPIVGSRTFETIVHVYDPKAFGIMLVLQALHHLHCKLEVFYPGTLEMFQMFGKHWIIFSTSCVMVWHILYLELKRCQCYTYNWNVAIAFIGASLRFLGCESGDGTKLWKMPKQIGRLHPQHQRYSDPQRRFKDDQVMMGDVYWRKRRHAFRIIPFDDKQALLCSKTRYHKRARRRMVCLNVSMCVKQGTTHGRETSCKMM